MSISEPLTRFNVRASAISRPTLSMDCSTAISSTAGRDKCGGDYAELFALPDGSAAIGVWDCSGNGGEASPAMVLVRARLRAALSMNAGVVDAARALNRVLFRRATQHAMPWPFVSAFFAVLNPSRKELSYVSCGHDVAVLFGSDGHHRHLSHNSPLLGVSEGSEFRGTTVDVASGDVLVVATDGITDARPLCSETKFFGSRGICSLFQPRSGGITVTAATVLDSAVTFSDGRLDDDAAVLVAHLA